MRPCAWLPLAAAGDTTLRPHGGPASRHCCCELCCKGCRQPAAGSSRLSVNTHAACSMQTIAYIVHKLRTLHPCQACPAAALSAPSTLRCDRSTANLPRAQKDGSKVMCSASGLEPPCIIYSLGSRNEYDFEQDMLERTSCHVHSFDCTVEGRSINPSRHTFHK